VTGALAQPPLSAAVIPAPPAAPVRVMLCDDSLVIRGALGRMLDAEADIRVVARAANGAVALEEIARQPIDVVILDIEMPVMDGLTVLPQLLKACPGTRVIMASTLTTRGADVAMRALRLGAVDYIPKPTAAAIDDNSFRLELLAKIRGQARLRRLVASSTRAAAPPVAGAALRLRPAGRNPIGLLAVGSSTGGPQALFTLVQSLGHGVNVPVVLTQHMPPSFIPILAEHLSRIGGMRCAEAAEGDMLRGGAIYMAPGDRHLCIEAAGAGFRARLSDGPPENFCRPSVDPMLRSANKAAPGRVLVAMLTGMGHDGLAGTREVIDAGGTALAQDEASSVVWGMPGAVAQAGLCHAVLPLDQMAAKIKDLLSARTR
jgi:two-component system, chemotaxis family, protein-glutamate methylesterase/glutaminase